jgi:hypothetical protein
LVGYVAGRGARDHIVRAVDTFNRDPARGENGKATMHLRPVSDSDRAGVTLALDL